MQNKDELEAEVNQGIIKFEKDYMGRVPLETKTYFVEDMVLVRIKGILSPAELKVVEAEETRQGRELIKQARERLLEVGYPLLNGIVKEILGVGVRSVFTDIDTKTGERIIVFTLESRPAHE